MRAFQQDKKATFRRLADDQISAASQQIHIFGQLLREHCGVDLVGTDLADCFAKLFHGVDWQTLMLSLEGEGGVPYYAISAREPLTYLSRQLNKLVGGNAVNTIRPLIDMPQAQYSKARSMEGALLATLVAGRPSWSLLNCSRSETPALVVDSENSQPYVPVYFNSDPMTNAERLCAIHHVTGEEAYIPIKQVKYTGALSQTVAEAAGLVRNPAERWKPSFTNLRSLLPEAEQADQEYQETLYTIRGPEAEGQINTAVQRYNRVLMRAVEAFWLDTREINSRDAIYQAFGTNEPEAKLAFSRINPLQKIMELLGEKPR